MAKQQNKTTQNDLKIPLKSIFNNNYILLGILLAFWLVFFRELLSGSAYLFDDFIEQYYPGKFMSSVMLSKGIIPFWNPFIFSGMPFLADLQIAVFYPFNFALTLFVKNDKLSALAIQNSILLHYLLTSVFTFYLAKHFKLSGLFSLLFALMFTYSSYMMVHMIHMPLVEAATWFPLFFLLWLKFISTGKYYYPLLAGFVMALCILAGYPQVPFFNFFFIGFYTLFVSYDFYKSGNIRKIIILFLGLVVTVLFTLGLSAFQLLPTLEFIGLSNRASFDYNFAKQGSMHIYDYITLIIPKYFGVWSGNEKIADLKYWSNHQEGPWMFSVANVFISTFVIILFYPSVKYFFKEKKHLTLAYFSLFIIIFSFLFSLGGNFFFHKLMYDFVPFFNRFRNPAHVVYIFMMAVLLLTMVGTDGIIKNGKLKEYYSKKYLLSIGSAVLLLFFITYSGMLLPVNIQQAAQVSVFVKSQALTFFVVSALFVVLIFLYSENKINSNIFGYLVLALLLFEIYYIWFDQNNGTKNPEQLYAQRTQLSEKFKQEMKSESFRVNARDGGYMLFQRNQGFVDNIEFLEGYGALMLKNFIPPNNSEKGSTQTHDLMNVKYKIFTDSTGKGKSLGLSTTYLQRVMMFYDAVRFSSDSLVKEYMNKKDFNYRKTLVVEEKDDVKLPKLNPSDSTPVSNTAKITEYSLNNIKVDVETTIDGLLFFSEVFYPAWKAYVDGKPVKILKTDYCMRSVPVEKGKHTVEMKYESDSFKNGLIYSFVSLGLLVLLFPLLLFISIRQKRNANIN